VRAVCFLLEALGTISVCFAGLRVVQYLASRIPIRQWSKDRFVLLGIYSGVDMLQWILICLFVAACVWGVRRMFAGGGLRDLGFRVSRSWQTDIWLGVVGFGLHYTAALPVLLAVFPAKAAHASGIWLKSLLDPAYPPTLLLAAWALSIGGNLLASFWEEIYFRGYFQGLCARLFSPGAAFYATLIFFSFGHLFTRREWTMLDALNSTIGAVVLLVLYHATGSLIAPTVAHWLSNAWWDYPFALHLHRDPAQAREFLLLLGAVSAVVCLAGWKQLRAILQALWSLLSRDARGAAVSGILLGAACLLYHWGLSATARTAGRWGTIAALVVFGVAALAASRFLNGAREPAGSRRPIHQKRLCASTGVSRNPRR
jgi:membrane protease YdiL (CAAX protease family)